MPHPVGEDAPILVEIPPTQCKRFELREARHSGIARMFTVWDSSDYCGIVMPGAAEGDVREVVRWLNMHYQRVYNLEAELNGYREHLDAAAQAAPDGLEALRRRAVAAETALDVSRRELSETRAARDDLAKANKAMVDELANRALGSTLEAEDQVKELAAENNLLRQRYDTLEKVHTAYVTAAKTLIDGDAEAVLAQLHRAGELVKTGKLSEEVRVYLAKLQQLEKPGESPVDRIHAQLVNNREPDDSHEVLQSLADAVVHADRGPKIDIDVDEGQLRQRMLALKELGFREGVSYLLAQIEARLDHASQTTVSALEKLGEYDWKNAGESEADQTRARAIARHCAASAAGIFLHAMVEARDNLNTLSRFDKAVDWISGLLSKLQEAKP